jgi:hypothetical protein
MPVSVKCSLSGCGSASHPSDLNKLACLVVVRLGEGTDSNYGGGSGHPWCLPGPCQVHLRQGARRLRRANGTDRRYSWGSVRLADQRLISSGDRKSTPRRRASPIGARRGRWHCQLSGRLPGPVPDGTLISAEHSGHFQKRMCALPSALRPAFCKIRFLLFSLHTAHNQ